MKNELTNNDQFITVLKQFNAYILSLQVNYVYELTTIDGKTLDDTIIGANITNRSEFNLLWPNQIQPTLKYLAKWIKKIKQAYCIQNSVHLKEQLIIGKLIQPHHTLTHKYKWIFSSRLLEVYHDYKTCSCKEMDHLTYSISNEINNQDCHPPSDSRPVYVQQNNFTITVNSQIEKSSTL